MSAAPTHASVAQQPSTARVGEWFWRFLAVVMVVVIGWVVWIAIQISPPEIILPAAYEAAAQGRALRNSGGTIGGPAAAAALPGQPADPSPAVPADASAVATALPVAAVVVEPPVNLEKLKRAESIETPIFERPRRAGRPASDTPQ
jgi:hypothetical protein